ncbi:hypothetical protein [Pacificoceanicola onchidii]|uniref:hypothetical protein n=1 Tax=Pacificoceanicola onchidii TaxID=2562685 RepID=UPI0010A5F50D|nr:hypothetical protein [Pacificoceanicola onchidii]
MEQKPTIEDVVSRLTEAEAAAPERAPTPLPRAPVEPSKGHPGRWVFALGGAIGVASLAALSMLR